MLFEKKKEESVEDYNKRLEDEVNKSDPPQPKADDGINAINVAGNILSAVGMSVQIVACIGCGFLAFMAFANLLGVSLITTVLILAGSGIVVSLIGYKMTTVPLLTPAFGG
jgi:hypothetical protein